MKKVILILSIFFMSAQSFAGAWNQDEGNHIAMGTVRFQETRDAKNYELNPFYEWGMSEDWTLGLNLNYRQSESKISGQDASQAGSVEIFARHMLMKSDFQVLSVQGLLGTSNDALGSQTQGDNANPTAEARLLWGVSSAQHNWGSLFLSSELAARSFFGKKGNEWRGEETLGWKLKSRKMILAQAFWTTNWNQDLGPRDYDSLQLQLSLVVPYKQSWHFQLGQNSTVAGRNVEYSPIYLFSVWYNWR